MTDDRVNYIARADYSEGTELDSIPLSAIAFTEVRNTKDSEI